MQPPTASPRTGFSQAQIVRLIQDTPSLIIDTGLELLDQSLTVIDDLSEDLAGGSVGRNSYATLHGTAQLLLSRELDWARAIVRPYMTLSDGVTTARFNLGAYLTSSPTTDTEQSPVTLDVRGYDILHVLNTRVGESFVVNQGESYLSAVEDILQTQGFTQYILDQTAAAATLPSPRLWVLDDNTTWLNIVNDLLAAIGYLGLWSDWDGKPRAIPYQLPTDRAPEWYYETSLYSSMLTPSRVIERDFFDTPNRWVFYRGDNADLPAPVEGNGIFTYVNQNDGPTSVSARAGRIVTATEQVNDFFDQTTLETQGRMRIESDLRLKTTFKLGVAPNPLHWHFDRVAVSDPALGALTECLVTDWTLPFSAEDMTHEWSVI